MTSYDFQSTLYRNAREMCEGIAGEWLSAGGNNSRSDMLAALASRSDAELSSEASEGWNLSDEWLSERDASRDMLTGAFSWLRKNFDSEYPSA